MRVRVGCRFLYHSPLPVPLLMAMPPPPHAGHRLVHQAHTLCPQVPLHTYCDSFGNTIWRLVTPVGALRTLEVWADAVPEDAHLEGLRQ